jgi:hypothetical protein
MIPDDFPHFAPVARLDTEHATRVHDDMSSLVWKRECLQAQADMVAMEHEHRRDKAMYFTAGFLSGLAVHVGLLGSLLTRFFG